MTRATRTFRTFRAVVARHPHLACLLLGAVAALGFAPLGWWPLTLAAMAAWAGVVHASPTQRAALARGWLFGLGHFTINDNWIQHAFDFQQQMPPALGYLAPVALALYLAVYPMLAAAVAWRARAARVDAGFVLVLAAAWLGAEWLRATMFTGYAWDPLGVIWVPVQPVAALAAWVGTYALSGLSVALAGALLLVPRRPVPLAGVAVGVMLLLGAQAASYRPAAAAIAPAADAPRVRIVQPGIGQDQRGETDGEVMHAALASLSGTPGPAPRLILWPEGVVREYLEDGYPYDAYQGFPPRWARARLASLLGPRDVLLAGGTALQFAPDGRLLTATNSIYAIDAHARIAARYDKAHLVPYGEYLPMRPLLSAIGLSRLVPGDIDFRAGPGPRAATLPPFGAIGMQLCYEIVFSGQVVDRAHRPRLLFNPSNDAWFGSWGPPQHLAQARMRAIEEGLPILRATPTGISAAIGADGALLASIPAGTRGAAELPLPAALPPTLFARVGNPMAALVALLLLAAAVAIRRRRG